MENGTIELLQKPVIKHKLIDIGKQVSNRIDSLNLMNQIASEDTIKTLKQLRADLNKESKEFELLRKTIKDSIMTPYNDFESVYKSEVIEKYRSADDVLKIKINEYELELKRNRKEELLIYFNELQQIEQLDWFEFDRLRIDINLSTSQKKYKEQILLQVQEIISDIDLISSEKYSSAILVEYKKTLKLSQSITTVRQRKESERQERERGLFERTKKRISKLNNLSFIYHGLTRTYNWIHDETVMITLSEIENLTDEEWVKKDIELESKIKAKQTHTQANILQAPTETETEKKDEIVKEKIFEATFSVTGTYNELTQLSEFLKSNNYKYQNIN